MHLPFSFGLGLLAGLFVFLDILFRSVCPFQIDPNHTCGDVEWERLFIDLHDLFVLLREHKHFLVNVFLNDIAKYHTIFSRVLNRIMIFAIHFPFSGLGLRQEMAFREFNHSVFVQLIEDLFSSVNIK